MTLQIDYKHEILYGVLQRMAPPLGDIKPILREYWVCMINPKISSKVLALIKSTFQFTIDNLQHLKRIHKAEVNGNTILKVLICPVYSEENQYTEDELSSILREATGEDTVLLEKMYIPMNKPLDKEINVNWSKKYWPLLWKGNPLVQDLNEIYKTIDIASVNKYMKKVVELSKTQKSEYPIVTIFVNPLKDEIESVRVDERNLLDPIKHTTMDGIAEIAERELVRRQHRSPKDAKENNYLCFKYHVYTSHEPCTMCSMGLVHSRISQLVYLKPSPKTGGIGKNSGHGEMIHLSCVLNWKFEAFQYLDKSLANEVKDLDPFLHV